MLAIDRSLGRRKNDLLDHFRQVVRPAVDRAAQSGLPSRSQAIAVNQASNEAVARLAAAIELQAANEGWTPREQLECALMATYTSYIAMIEGRNEVWPYDYMTFSRRIGELWEPFCMLTFRHPAALLSPYIPPTFAEIRARLQEEVGRLAARLPISDADRTELLAYFDSTWSLVTSGDIRLEADLHFEQAGKRYVVDFKSGFGSNEKGNTNRLLMVATIYASLKQNYQCVLVVRSTDNNAYFDRLRASPVWDARAGADAYRWIAEHSGFDLRQWIDTNIDWQNDFAGGTYRYFLESDLVKYLNW